MCKALDEGGQRCASHGREAVTKAQAEYDRFGTDTTLHALIDAHVEYASTPEGHQAALANLEAGDPAPGELPSEMWARIAADGDLLRERNQAVKQAIKASAAKGDAFYADVREKWGSAYYVPNGVRGPKSLEKFLDDETEKWRLTPTSMLHEQRIAERLTKALDEIEAAPITPDATPEQRLPRSEAERDAWVAHLAQSRKDAAMRAAGRKEVLEDASARLAKFGRPAFETDPDKITPVLDQKGTLVRLRDANGSLSEEEYIVWGVHDGDLRAEGATTVTLMPVNGTVENEVTPATWGSMPEISFRGKGVSTIGERLLSPSDLAPATPETTAKFAGTHLEFVDDHYTTEVAPGQHHSTVRAWTAGGRELAHFDQWRAEWAEKNAPYPPRRPDGTPQTFSDRVKGFFA